jgi:hypothetical protein
MITLLQFLEYIPGDSLFLPLELHNHILPRNTRRDKSFFAFLCNAEFTVTTATGVPPILDEFARDTAWETSMGSIIAPGGSGGEVGSR